MEENQYHSDVWYPPIARFCQWIIGGESRNFTLTSNFYFLNIFYYFHFNLFIWFIEEDDDTHKKDDLHKEYHNELDYELSNNANDDDHEN